MKQIIVRPLERSTRTIRCSTADFILRGFTPRVALAYPTRLDPERLARALARVLSDYSAFAGRLKLRPDAMLIEPSNQGVPLEIVGLGD